MTKVFISYAWDSKEHKTWVRNLSTRLKNGGVDVTLDQWHLVPGDQIPEFMERAVRESDFVLIVCTQKYKERSDARSGGVGYEGDVMTVVGGSPTAAILESHNDHRIAMASAVGGLRASDIVKINNPECVAKSYPEFFEDLNSVRSK